MYVRFIYDSYFMRKLSVFIWLPLVLLSSCISQPNSYVEYYNRKTNFVKSADIKSGEKLRKSHRDEEFVIEDYVEEITFSKNKDYEDWKKSQNAKRKKFKKLKWTKNSKTYTVNLDDEFSDAEIKKIKEEYETRYRNGRGVVNEDDFGDFIEDLKRDRNSTPPGKYMSNEKHSYMVTSLRDFNNYAVHLFYNKGESIKNFKFDYGRGAFEPNFYVKSYESAGVFHNDAKIFFTLTDLPTLGSHVYVDYDHEYPDISYNTVVYVPEDDFVERKVISFAVPTWLDITIVEKNLEGVKFTKTATAPKKLKKKMLPNQVKDVVDEDGKPINKKSKASPKQRGDAASGVKYITYEFTNVKPFSKDGGDRGPSYNYPHLLIQYNYATEGTEKVPMTGTLEGLYGWYHSLVMELKNDTTELKKFTQKLIADKSTDDEKIKAIYYWVQDNIRYIAFEDGLAGFKPEECADVFNNRYGDCKGMANLMVNMLKVAGYDARRVWIGTRHLNYDYSTPSLAVDNHMIAAIKKNTGFVFLDGTESYCPYGEYAHRIQGRQVLIEDGEKYILSRVPESGPESNITDTKISAWFDGKDIKAKVNQTMKGESRLNFVRGIQLLKTNRREHVLYSYIGGNNISIEPSNIVTSDIEDRETDGTLAYDLTVFDHMIRTQDKIYINLDWEKELGDLNFDSTRQIDVDFHEKMYVKTETTMDLGSFKIEHLPTDVVEENDYYKVLLRMAPSGNTLFYRKEIILKQGYLPVSELKKWNEVNEKITLFYKDYIILK